MNCEVCIYRETEKVGTMEVKLCALSKWGRRERERKWTFQRFTFVEYKSWNHGFFNFSLTFYPLYSIIICFFFFFPWVWLNVNAQKAIFVIVVFFCIIC